MLLLDAELDTLLAAIATGDARVVSPLFAAYLAAEPRAGRKRHLAGLQLLARGHRGEASARLEAAALEAPDAGAIRNNHGHVLMLREQWDAAAAQLRAAHALLPSAIEPLVNLADILALCDLPSEARRVLDRALAIAPDHPDTALRLLRLSLRLSDQAGAAHAASILARAPAPSAAASYGLGRYCEHIGDLDAAARHFSAAAAMGSGAAHSRLARQALDRHDLDALTRHAALATTLAPDDSDAWRVRALSHQLDGDLAGARRAAHLAFACSRQTARDVANYIETLAFDLGTEVSLAGYESRWSTRTPQPEAARSRFSGRRWLGQPAGSDHDLLIHTEQGLGDALQYIRCVSAVQALGWRVHLATHPALLRLLARVPGVASVTTLEEAAALPWHCPTASLPFAVEPQLGDPAASVPYVSADPADIETWRRRLAGGPGPTVGLVTSCNPRHPRHAQRSIPWALIAPLARVAGVTFVLIQPDEAGGPPRFRRAPSTWPGPARLLDVSDHGGDLLETAAAIAALDLLVTVDTALLHLGGALGQPVWALLSAYPQARWLPRPGRTWYPTVRLFQQSVPGDWTAVIESVRAELSAAYARK